MKYRPENSAMPDPNAAVATPHVGHYGPDPTQLQQNQAPSSSSGSGAVNFNHSLTPFGGSSSAMTPFGGASSSFSGPVSNSFSGAVSSELCFIINYDDDCGGDCVPDEKWPLHIHGQCSGPDISRQTAPINVFFNLPSAGVFP